MRYTLMFKWTVPVRRYVARHVFDMSRIRHDPVVDRLRPAYPVICVGLRPLLWHAVPA